MYIKILGIKIDKVTKEEAFKRSVSLLKMPGKHLIVTPNVEFVMKAQKDKNFIDILNSADMAIPDSARFTWALAELESRGLKRFMMWPFFLTNRVPGVARFPVVTGVDLMEELVAKSGDYGFTTAFFGGQRRVAERARECLLKKYPKAKIVYVMDGGRIDKEGNFQPQTPNLQLPKVDFLFVALGQVKQEKWIDKNKKEIPAKVFMGVGGALDYLSGSVPRAPIFMRNLGLEWLFRIIKQPWRAKRFVNLIKFTLLCLTA